MKIQKKANWLMLLIITVSVIGMIVFGVQKEGYHVDEMYSYGLANSEYLPFMHFGESGYDVKDWMKEYGAGESFGDLFRNLGKDFRILKEHEFRFYNTPIYHDYRTAQMNSADTRTTTWVSGQDYRDYLAVSESNTFNYASVYYNQRGDVHPPFYYMVLHTVCSVFQGEFSKWFGLGVNMMFLGMTMFLLYHMFKKYLGGEKTALAVLAVYGLSNGFFTCAVFLRMYAVMTFMVVATCFIHLKIAREDFKLDKKNVSGLVTAVFLGYLTHYYFVIYAIGVAAVFVVWMCIRKKWRTLFQYIFALSATAIAGLCVWPFAVKHVFSGYRGQESLGIILNGEFYWIKIKLMLDQIFGQLFGGKWWIPAVCGCFALIGIILLNRKDVKWWGSGALVFVPVVIYIVAVAQIVPYYVDRYVMCTYPFWCLLVVFGIGGFIGILKRIADRYGFLSEKKELTLSVMYVILVLALMWNNSGFLHMPGYLGKNGQETYTVPEGAHCVYVLPDGTWNESAEDTLILSKCEQVAVVYRSNLECLAETYDHQGGDCVILTIQKSLDEEAVVKEAKKILNIEHLEEAFREEAYNTMRIYYQ